MTGQNTGTVPLREIMQGERGDGIRHENPTSNEYILAAHIRGKVKANPEMADEKPAAPKPGAAEKPAAAEKPGELNVVLVADVDMISPAFFSLREQSEIPELGIRFEFDNVTFVLNALDELANDSRFVDIRSRRPKHRTLTRIEEQTKESKQAAADQRKKYYEDCEKEEEETRATFEKEIQELQSRGEGNSIDKINAIVIAQRDNQRKLESKKEQLAQTRDRKVNKIQTDLSLKMRAVQSQAKWLAVLLPPIPPLVLGTLVFFTRRSREREGVSRKRLR